MASPGRLSAAGDSRPVELTAARDQAATNFSPAALRVSAPSVPQKPSGTAERLDRSNPASLETEAVPPVEAPAPLTESELEPLRLEPGVSSLSAPVVVPEGNMSLSESMTSPTPFPSLATEEPAALPSEAPMSISDAVPSIDLIDTVSPEQPAAQPTAQPTAQPAAQPMTAQPAKTASRQEVLPSFSDAVAMAKPGPTALEGPQKAELILTKELPAEIQIGREDTFKIILRNTGAAAARGVILRDPVPAGTTLVSSTPQADTSESGELVWSGFDLAPSEERSFEYRVVPQVEGTIGSVASVSWNTEVSAKTLCTRPLLKLSVESPEDVLIGEDTRLEISISNPGTGAAHSVVLTEEVPQGLSHAGGELLNNSIGEIAAGETKKLSLTLRAAAAGTVSNRLKVTADGGLSQEAVNEIRINAPELALEITGSKVRYLERESVYRLKVWNPGTASASELKLTAELPPQMKFVATNNEGVYQESTHTVHWELLELPNNIAPGDIELTLLPIQVGTGQLTFRGEGNLNLAASASRDIVVDGMPALSFSAASLSDPVEVGQEAVYEIRISNRGTKESKNVNLAVMLPESMEIVEADGPTRYSPQTGAAVFAPLAQVGAKEEVVYKLTMRCSAIGDHRMKVQVSSDDMQPLVKEESVRVYGEN